MELLDHRGDRLRSSRPLTSDVFSADRMRVQSYESGFHCFRHTAGNLVNAETGNLKLVQGLLRHAQLSTTADTYVHNLPESDREVARILESKIFRSCSQLFPIWVMSVFTRRLTTSCNVMRSGDLGLEVDGTPGAI